MPVVSVQRKASGLPARVPDLPTTTEPSADVSKAALFVLPGKLPSNSVVPPDVHRIATPLGRGIMGVTLTTTAPSAETAAVS
jgi:hypothetical protein